MGSNPVGATRLPGVRSLTTVCAAVLIAAVVTAIPAPAEGSVRQASGPNAIPGRFVVVRADQSDTNPANTTDGMIAWSGSVLSRAGGGTPGTFFTTALKGFSARMTDQQARRVAADPSVAYVQQSQRHTIVDTQANPSSFGLDRIDQPSLPLDRAFSPSGGGQGVNVYVVDTGIRRTHREFGGRARTGFDAITPGGDATDCNGHGTHVAGTVGGRSFGVAKEATLFAVRVLDCQGGGSTESVVAGIDFVTENAVKPAVANMSLGGNIDPALDAAVQRAIDSGVTFTIAAGNGNAQGIGVDACGTSPARVPGAVTVGAVDRNDQRARFSNTGQCVDVFAPGVDITSSFADSDTATDTISGTSMASPHVAGAAALVLQGEPNATPARVQSVITGTASVNKLRSTGSGSPNRMLQVPTARNTPVGQAPGNRSGRGANRAAVPSPERFDQPNLRPVDGPRVQSTEAPLRRRTLFGYQLPF